MYGRWGATLACATCSKAGVRKGGNRLRVTAQLIDAGTGNHLWAEKYDGAVDDVFDLQDKITAGVVGIIEPNVRLAEIERARRKRPDNLDAYDLYLRALPLAFANVPEEAARRWNCLTRPCASIRILRRGARNCGVVLHPGLWARHVRPEVSRGRDPACPRCIGERHRRRDGPRLRWLCARYSRTRQASRARRRRAGARRSIPIPRSRTAAAPMSTLSPAGWILPLNTPRSRSGSVRWIRCAIIAGNRRAHSAYFHEERYAERCAKAHAASFARIRDTTLATPCSRSCVKLGQIDEAREAIRRLREANPLFTLGGLASFSMGTEAQMEALLAALREAGLPE